ncbi:oleosin 20.3 kDa-like [Fagus crenata]
MAESREVFISGPDHDQHVHGKSVLCASLVGIAIGGPLLGMMGLSFLVSVTLLIVSSPLLLLSSPILFFAGLVLVGAVASFSVAALMAMTGLSTLGWVVHQVRGGGRDMGFVEGLKEWAGYLQHDTSYNNRNRGWKEQGGGI